MPYEMEQEKLSRFMRTIRNIRGRLLDEFTIDYEINYAIDELDSVERRLSKEIDKLTSAGA